MRAQLPDALERLRSLIAAEHGLLACALVEPATATSAFGPLAAAGSRAAARAQEYDLLVESVFEGYLLHYAGGRLVAPSDPDLRLLGGDYLYALGLARLARLGDMEAVAELADLISLCAQAHAAGDPPPWQLVGGLWALSALAVGSGRWPEQHDVKIAARSEATSARIDAREVAVARARELGLGGRLEQALIAFDCSVEQRTSTT